MKDDQVGNFTPRYKFILNPYDEFRLSKCPICQKMTHIRKFALLIHIEGWGLLTLGKTCRYCTPCELIIAHQDELEDELVGIFEEHAPEVIGNPYMAIGTVDKKLWKKLLGKRKLDLDQASQQMSPLKDVLNLKMEGGWQPVKNP